MKIEAGKLYKTRDGRKIGPMQSVPNCCFYKWEAVMGGIRHSYSADGRFHDHRESSFDLMAEWTDEPRPWGELTDAEKGALLLAEHNNKKMEWLCPAHGEEAEWRNCSGVGAWSDYAYRVAPEPVVETVTLNIGPSSFGGWGVWDVPNDKTFALTFTIKDGEPATGTFTNEDGDVIKMERIDV